MYRCTEVKVISRRLAVVALAVLFVLVLVGLGISARSGFAIGGGDVSVTSKEPDAVEVFTLGKQATLRVQQVSPGAILRQVDVNPTIDARYFRFTDAPATQELMVTANPGVPLEEWPITQSYSPLVHASQPGIDLMASKLAPHPLHAQSPPTGMAAKCVR